MQHLRLASILGILALVPNLACGGDDGDDTYGSLDHSAVLGELDSAQSRALCDATEESYQSTIADADNKRAQCMAQIASDLEVAMLNIELGAAATPDDLVDLCETALERCLDEGPMHTPCMTIDFDASCNATVGDFAHCNASAGAVLPMFAEIDCETYIKDAAAEDQLQEAALDALKMCGMELLGCDAEVTPDPDDDEEPWFDVTLSEFRDSE